MFAQLLASRPVRQQSTAGMVTSVGLHGFLVAAAVSATVATARTVDRTTAVATQYVELPPARPPATPPVHAPPNGTPVVSVPITIPTLLPPLPAVQPGTPIDLLPSTRFIPGGTATPPGTGVEPGAAYLATQVEIEVALERHSPMPRFPASLRAAGIEGSARFRFVVDTLGRVEMASVERMEATHEAFAVAFREALHRMRFRAASVGGRPVRQLVEFPIAFRVRR